MDNTIDIKSFFPNEEIKFQRRGFLVKNIFNVKTGAMVITNKRVAFIEKKMIAQGHEIIDMADKILKVSQAKLKVNVPFEELNNYSWPKKHDLLIENNSGEKFKFRPIYKKEVIDFLPKI